MKRMIFVWGLALLAFSITSAESVNSQFRSIPVDALRSAFSAFIDGHKNDPLIPFGDILEGDPTIVSNDLGMTVLRLGQVTFDFDKFANVGEIVAVATYHAPKGSDSISLRCVFILVDGKLALKEYKTKVEQPHL